MKKKNLAEQFNDLKKIMPAADWKVRNREVLISQIYGSQIEPSASKGDWVFYFRLPLALARGLSQPTLAAILIFVFLAGGTFASVKVAENTKPGDALYIAKIINEKTQLALTFDEKGKAQLGLEFATNRVDEMNKVLAEENNGKNDQKVEQLVSNFKDQIKDVRTRIAKINPDKSRENVVSAEKTNNNNAVFSADSGKENQGIQTSETVADIAVKVIKDGKAEINVAATSQELKVDSSKIISTTTTPVATTAEILNEAGKLLNENNYSATLQKIDEADKSLVKVEKVETKSEGESATSTAK
jgi:hypothetical protein